MKDNPFVSVIVTTYNRKELLRQTIDSILIQSYQNFELIVIDNFSNYDFWEFIESYHSDKIRAFQNQNNGIIAINRNFAISKAKGAFLAFCDDDDIWLPEKLQKQVEILQGNAVDLVCSNANLFIDNPNAPINRTRYTMKKSIGSFLKKNPIVTSSVIVRRNDKLSFDESKCFVAVEDFKLWISLFIDGYKMHIIDEPLINYRLSPYNNSRQNPVIFNIKHITLFSALLIEGKAGFWMSSYFIFINLVKAVVKFIFYSH